MKQARKAPSTGRARARARGPWSGKHAYLKTRRIARDLKAARFRRRKAAAMAPPVAVVPNFSSPEYAFTVAEQRGTVTVLGPQKFPVLEGFWAGVELGNGDVLTTCQTGLTAGGGFWFADLAGGAIRIEIALKRSLAPAGALVTVSVRNLGAAPLDVRTIRVAHAALGRERQAWGPPEGWRVLRMGYTFGGAHGEDQDKRTSGLVSMDAERVETRSWGVLAIRFAGETAAAPDAEQGGAAGGHRGLVAGFATAGRQLAWLDLRRDRGEIELVAVCEQAGAPIPPGGVAHAETLFLGLCEDVRQGLREYAGLLARSMKVKLKPVPTGWCSWYQYRAAGVTDENVMANARFVAAHRATLPLDVIQIDDGWAPALGDWLGTNARFPRGLEPVARDIAKLKLTPGIWAAPFVATASSALFREHPGWMVRTDEGKPLGWEVDWADPKEPWYALDPTNPEARAWLVETFRTLKGWGFRYFKLDFLFLGLLKGVRHEPVTRAAAYRRGLEAVREGVGPDAYLLACTAPYPESAGLSDGIRASHDMHPGGDLWSSFSEAARESQQRWWAHRVLWNTDHDALIVREVDGSSADLARALAASVEMTGGALFASDALPDLPPERLEILTDALARRHGAAATPLDVFDRPAPRVLSLPLGRRRFRVALFNDTNAPRASSVDLNWFDLARARVSVLGGPKPVPLLTAKRRFLSPPIGPRGVAVLLIEGD